MKNGITQQGDPALALRGMVNAFQKSRIVLTAFELDVFTVLQMLHSLQRNSPVNVAQMKGILIGF